MNAQPFTLDRLDWSHRVRTLDGHPEVRPRRAPRLATKIAKVTAQFALIVAFAVAGTIFLGLTIASPIVVPLAGRQGVPLSAADLRPRVSSARCGGCSRSARPQLRRRARHDRQADAAPGGFARRSIIRPESAVFAPTMAIPRFGLRRAPRLATKLAKLTAQFALIVAFAVAGTIFLGMAIASPIVAPLAGRQAVALSATDLATAGQLGSMWWLFAVGMVLELRPALATIGNLMRRVDPRSSDTTPAPLGRWRPPRACPSIPGSGARTRRGPAREPCGRSRRPASPSPRSSRDR